MRFSQRILCVALLAGLLCTGCSKEPEINIDDQIPDLNPNAGITSESADTVPETSEVITHQGETGPVVSPVPTPSYEDTYEGLLQEIYDRLYAFTDDIKAVQGTDGYNSAYDTTLQLADVVLSGKSRINQVPRITSNVKGLIPDYYFDTNIVKLFEKYPEQAKQETDLIEFARHYCYIYSDIGQGSTENLYLNDDFYNAIFPNTQQVFIENSDSGVVIGFEGYNGNLVYVERADRLNRVRHLEVYEDSISISNYSGTISVAPVNKYGATGRTTQVQVNTINNDIITSLMLSGDHYIINPDLASQEYIELANNAKVRTASPSYLDLIQNTNQLQILQVSYCEITDASALFDKITAETIITLELSNNLLTELELSQFNNLDSLDVRGNTSLASLKMPAKDSILYVNLRDTALMDLSMFASYNKISTLDIRDTKITDLTGLAGKTIYTLDFNADITDYHGLQNIKDLKSLNIISEKALSAELLELVKGIHTITEFLYNNETVALK